MPDLVIRRATLPDGSLTDLAVEDGRISEIGPELPAAAREIDASGLSVLPGLIDVHVHFNEPGRTEWEGGASGSRAFAAGGGTLFFDMPLNSTPCTVGCAEFDRKAVALAQTSITDFALWGGLIPGNVEALPELASRGVIGFKAFMSDSGLPEFPRADDLTLYEGMQQAAALNLPVAVHAESEELTKALTQKLAAEGRTSIRDYLSSRPVLAEVEAIQRALLLAEETGAKLHIVHISSGRGVAIAAEARVRGVDVSIETCPHYLFFTEEDVVRLGAVAKCAPPLRAGVERDALWSAVFRCDIDIVSSDHSPAPPDLKQDSNFFHVWGGIAGVQSTLAVLLEEGHYRRGLPLSRIAELTAENPARRFGIQNKGSIAAGQDADLVLIDLTAHDGLVAGDLLYRHRLSPYVGSQFRGAVRHTLRRGELIYSNGQITAQSCGTLVRPFSH